MRGRTNIKKELYKKYKTQINSIQTSIRARVLMAYFILVLISVLIIYKIFSLQQFEGVKWKKLADSLSTKIVNIDALRGSIYSEDGSLMATSVPEYEIRMDINAATITDKIFEENVDSLAICLSTLFKDKSATDYKLFLTKSRAEKQRYLLIQRKVNFAQLKELKTFPILKKGKYKGGLMVIQSNKRIHPFQQLAHRTIGYYVEDVKPVGIEGAFNEQLSGNTGKRLMQRIAGGVWMPVNDEDEIGAIDGSDVITTLNVNTQDLVQTALLKQLIAQNAKSGTVILMEVESGEVRAIANMQRVSYGVYEENFNTAIGSATEPGSTIKLASFMVALEDGKIKLSDTIDVSSGSWVFMDRTMKDAHTIPDKSITLQTVFDQSSNIGVARTISKYYKNNPNAFIKGLERMGLGRQIGIQLPGEAMPYFKRPGDNDWYGTTLPWLAIGYEQTITPLQILTFYNAVANNGVMVAPKFVKEIQYLGGTVKTYPTEVLIEKIASDKTLEQARLLLEGVIKNGSGKNIQTELFDIAGKTGTAQIADGNKGYHDKLRYQASFCGYFPANNPKYSMIVVINEPSAGLYYGATIAAPVFKEIAEKVFSNQIEIYPTIESLKPTDKPDNLPLAKIGYVSQTMQVYDKLGIPYSPTDKSKWGYTVYYKKKVEILPITIKENVVPDVSGMGLTDAIYILENAGLKTTASGRGKVISQSISAGTSIKPNTTIHLELR